MGDVYFENECTSIGQGEHLQRGRPGQESVRPPLEQQDTFKTCT